MTGAVNKGGGHTPGADSKLREQIIHDLRMQGWSRIDAETEAEDRIERLRDKARGE